MVTVAPKLFALSPFFIAKFGGFCQIAPIRLIPHLKGLISGYLEPKAQGRGNFLLCAMPT